MPELPDITVYLDALERHVLGTTLARVEVANPFLLRTVTPPVDSACGRRVVSLQRLGKRIVVGLADELFLVIHLMVAGRLRWRKAGARPPRRGGLAAFHFSSGTLLLTEAGSTRRASLHVISGQAGLTAHDPGGIDPLNSTATAFAAALTSVNHTLKRALTDPRILSGIGNAYSDEILHRARMSPFTLTARMTGKELEQLRAACVSVLEEWIERLRAETGSGFPETVTAFHDEMAVHGRYGQPCPTCSAPVQRIVYASSEANYCAACQTGGRLLADRALSRLLKSDWPRTLEELEALRNTHDGNG